MSTVDVDLYAWRVRLFLIKSVGVVELHQISNIEERKEEAETFPHPRMET